MNYYCLSVVAFHPRPFASRELHAGAVFIATPTDLDKWQWTILKTLGPVRGRHAEAAADCLCEMTGTNGPYLPGVTDGSEVDATEYNRVCARVGLSYEMPVATSEPTPDPKEGSAAS